MCDSLSLCLAQTWYFSTHFPGIFLIKSYNNEDNDAENDEDNEDNVIDSVRLWAGRKGDDADGFNDQRVGANDDNDDEDIQYTKKCLWMFFVTPRPQAMCGPVKSRYVHPQLLTHKSVNAVTFNE